MSALSVPTYDTAIHLATCMHYAVSQNRISDVIDCNLKKHYQILIIFGTSFLTQLPIKWPFKFPPHPSSASALPGKNRRTKILHFYPRQYYYLTHVKHILSIFLSLWLC